MTDTKNWTDAAEDVRWNIRPFIDGSYSASSANETSCTINPATETPLSAFAVGSAIDVDKAVAVARRRFDQGCWSGLPAVERARILFKLADLIGANKEKLGLLDCLEMGKPIQAAQYDSEVFATSLLRSWADFATKLLGQAAPLTSATVAFNSFEPRGVVGAIVPWNFPTVNAIYKLGPALAAGNTLVLKPSEISPSSALKLAELALEAGVPEGVLNVVPGLGHTVGAALALHTDVDMLSFTGSTATGRKVMEMCGRSNSKPLLLECGGKSPQIVFSDVAALDRVADAIVQSFLWNQGQVCIAQTRLIVHSQIVDDVMDRVMARARTYVPGDPLDSETTFGPLASPTQRDRVKTFIERGIDDGARAVLRGEVREAGGCYVEPTIFDRVNPTMTIVQEEIFGPVLCVQEFEDEETALALANGTAYGLQATVWTSDFGRGKRMARGLKVGNVSVRTSGREESDSGYVFSHEPQGSSGFGAEAGLGGLQSYSTLKSVTFCGA